MSREEVLARLEAGEWVETELIGKYLGISFSDGLKRFDMARTAEWMSVCGKTKEERAMNGQRVVTKFRKKTEDDLADLR